MSDQYRRDRQAAVDRRGRIRHEDPAVDAPGNTARTLVWDGRSGMLLVGGPDATIPFPGEAWPDEWTRIGGALVHCTDGLLTADVHSLWTDGRPWYIALLSTLTAPAKPAPVRVAWLPDDDGPALTWPIRERTGCASRRESRSVIRVQWTVGDVREVSAAMQRQSPDEGGTP